MPRITKSFDSKYRINNPGGGDCGFYAFAVGLIDIIQKEYALSGKSDTFVRWKNEGLKGVSLRDIISFDLNQLYESPYSYQTKLLSTLQMSLRTIATRAYTDDLISKIGIERALEGGKTKVESTPVFGKFMELVHFYLYGKGSLEELSHFNELALAPEVTNLAQSTARSLQPKLQKKLSEAQKHRIENAHVKEALLKDVMRSTEKNPDSVILRGVEKIQEEGRWATHNDLKEVAARLHINLHVIGKLNGEPDPHLPTVILNNEGKDEGMHWTTQVDQLPRKAPKPKNEDRNFSEKEKQVINATVSTQIKTDKVNNYRQHVTDLIHAASTHGLFSQVKNKIDIDTIDKAEAVKGESDEEFARRLQEAEYRRALK